MNPDPLAMPARRRSLGFTLIELMIVIAIIGILAALATVKYLGYIEKVRVARAILDVKSIQTEIDAYMFEGGPPPASLAAAGLLKTDPWGFTYRYLALKDSRGRPTNQGAARRDRFLIPLNDDYDLYSIGKDGLTSVSLASSRSQDDVVRANDGAFIGLAVHY
jgi:general secretion pathway protein G